jgi:hypothetical protein
MRSLFSATWPVLLATILALGAAPAPAQDAPPPRNGASNVFAADLNADGAPDVVVASPRNNEIVWYRNGDPRGTFGNRTVISTEVRLTKSVVAHDADNDGDRDIISASSFDNKLAWYPNTDGYGTFGDQSIFENKAGSPHALHGDDLDGDGDVDLLFASNGKGKIAWCRNDGGSFTGQNVISTAAEGAQSVHAADLDSDGDKDAISVSSSFSGVDKVSWYRNTAGGFASQNVISKKMKNVRSVIGADLDGDGDQDVASASAGDGKIAWYENTSGYGTFSSQKVVTTKAPGVQTISAADVDGDGDLDLLSASNKNGKLAWYENIDGKKAFSSQKVIASQGNYRAVYATDLDVDGDPDLLFISESEGRVGWCSNQIEQGNGFTSPRMIGP